LSCKSADYGPIHLDLDTPAAAAVVALSLRDAGGRIVVNYYLHVAAIRFAKVSVSSGIV
jgi:hypothetical protein